MARALTLTLLLFLAASTDARDLLTSTEGMTVGQFRALGPLDRADAAKIALESARKEHELCNQRDKWHEFHSDVFNRTGVYESDKELNSAALFWLGRRCRLLEIFSE